MKVVGTIRCCSFFEFLIVTFRQHFLVPPPPRVILVLKAIMLPLQEELWRVFSPKQQTFWPGSLPYWGDDENKCYNNTEGYEVHCHVTTAPLQY